MTDSAALVEIQIADRVMRRRARQVGIEASIGDHSLRATGVTDYLMNGGTLEYAQQMVNHSSTRTTMLYDLREADASRMSTRE